MGYVFKIADIGRVNLQSDFGKSLYESTGDDSIFCEAFGLFFQYEQRKEPASLDVPELRIQIVKVPVVFLTIGLQEMKKISIVKELRCPQHSSQISLRKLSKTFSVA